MVVFYQHHIEEAEAMVEGAAAGDGIFFQPAPAGCGFARVEDTGVCWANGLDKTGGQGGDAREALDEIQGHPFGGEDRPGRAGDAQESLAGLHLLAVSCQALKPECRGKLTEGGFGQIQPGHYQRFAGPHPSGGGGIRRHGG